jgi:hypothetical protein
MPEGILLNAFEGGGVRLESLDRCTPTARLRKESDGSPQQQNRNTKQVTIMKKKRESGFKISAKPNRLGCHQQGKSKEVSFQWNGWS